MNLRKEIGWAHIRIYHFLEKVKNIRLTKGQIEKGVILRHLSVK